MIIRLKPFKRLRVMGLGCTPQGEYTPFHTKRITFYERRYFLSHDKFHYLYDSPETAAYTRRRYRETGYWPEMDVINYRKTWRNIKKYSQW